MANSSAAGAGETLLIQFAREPVPGGVKTRMIPHLSPARACELHSELVLWTSRNLAAAALGDVQLAVAGDSAHPLFQRCLALGVQDLVNQRGTDLGERMYNALVDGLARYRRVILVGSDCPALDRQYLLQALQALEREPLVIGPADDGGYVLLGARAVRREMFAGITWGTDSVYCETAERLRELGLGWGVLPSLPDIDRPGDLAGWLALQGR